MASSSSPSIAEFHWIDYLVFGLTLALAGAIGIYYAITARRARETARDVLLGGRNLGILPVTLSLMASFLSAILVLGVPADTFKNNTMYLLIAFSNLLTFPVVAHAVLPVFRRTNLTSAYEYLEKRFNRSVRILGSILFMLQMLLYMAVVLYAPALALSQVMGLSMLLSILVAGLVCTIYTAIGGLKAVVWTDTFQMAIVLGGLLAVIIKGTMEAGGVSSVLDVADQYGKLKLNNFDPSPFTRYTFWSLVIGGFFTSMTIYGANQAMIQRYLAMPSTKQAQIALYLNMPAAIIFTTLLVFLGLLAFARYHDDDPLQSCRIQKSDQLIPLLVMDTLGGYHGLPGLFVACVFSASLSTVSSGVNALAAVFLTDIVRPAYRLVTQRNLSNSQATVVSKIVALLFGLATIGLAFVAGELGPLILQIALSIFGIFGGPLLGLFVLALFVPCANSWGAITGLLTSVGVSFWLAIGSTIQRNNNAPPPIVCTTNQTTAFANGTATASLLTTTTLASTSAESRNFTENVTDESGLSQFYKLSFMWYSFLAVIVAVLVGCIVSLITGGTRSKPVDARYLSPWCVWMSDLCNVTHDTAAEQSESEEDSSEDRKRNAVAVLAEMDVPKVEVSHSKDTDGVELTHRSNGSVAVAVTTESASM